jgi:hypothetical protein
MLHHVVGGGLGLTRLKAIQNPSVAASVESGHPGRCENREKASTPDLTECTILRQ